MSKVVFKQTAYRYKELKPVVFDMLDAIAPDLFAPNRRVLIKPNLLAPAKPEKAVITHPLVVRIVAEYIIKKGARPVIADSPPMGSLEKILKEGGYLKAFRGLDVEFKAFKESVKVDIGEPFGQIDIARDAIEADVVVNLAKLKTHSQMRLTLGVKNLFGCVIGYKKPEWHLRAGIDRHFFARLLVQIYLAVRPTITLVDGIWALEGQGPGKSGTPRRLGVLVGGQNAVDIDRAICRMLNLDPKSLPTHRAAVELGLLSEKSLIQGDFHIIDDFRMPVIAPLTFGPEMFRTTIRKHLIQRPVVDLQLCKRCQECIRYCPANAIREEKNRIEFDYNQCIRCYCCIEVCPHGALTARETLTGRLVRRLTNLH